MLVFLVKAHIPIASFEEKKSLFSLEKMSDVSSFLIEMGKER